MLNNVLINLTRYLFLRVTAIKWKRIVLRSRNEPEDLGRMVNSVDPDQTDLGLHYLLMHKMFTVGEFDCGFN